MIFIEAHGIDHRICGRKLGRKLMMIGNDHLNTVFFGVINRLMFADPGIAGQEDIKTVLDDFFQLPKLDPVGFGFPHRDMVDDVSAEISESGDEKGC